VSLLLLAALALQDPFAGFPEGSWVILERLMKSDGREETRRERKTVVKDGVRIERDRGNGFEDDSVARHIHGKAPEDLKATSSREEDVTVGDRKIRCKVTEYADEREGVRVQIAVWRGADLKIPYRELQMDGPDIAAMPDVLRIEASVRNARGTETQRLKVVSLGEKLKVGARDVECVVEEVDAEAEQGGRKMSGTMKRWLSAAVPGHLVKRTLRADIAGKPVEQTEQAADFEVKK